MSEYVILIVDDEPNVIKSLKRLFIASDYKLLSANSGKEGLKVLNENKVHLVISDYRMPEMNGVQFLKKVKEKYTDTIRIILSGYADVSAIVEAINDGQVYKFLSKPWNDQELLTTIKRSLEHFMLQEENAKLLNELKSSNLELIKLMRNLEIKVEERTNDLKLKNRALEISQKILYMLPVGVICVDSDFMIVYLNQAVRSFVDISLLELGGTIKNNISDKVIEKIDESIQSSCNLEFILDEQNKIGCSINSLSNKNGVVIVFSKINLVESRNNIQSFIQGS